MTMATFKVKMFGLFREAAGKKEVTLSFDSGHITVADLKKRLLDSYPALASTNTSTLIAVNRKVAADSATVLPDDEIALLPMISGG
jgi:molybdopterin converting factor small subunit